MKKLTLFISILIFLSIFTFSSSLYVYAQGTGRSGTDPTQPNPNVTSQPNAPAQTQQSPIGSNGGSSTGCKKSTFFGLPPWYKYLEFENANCDIKFDATKPTDYSLIALAILEMLLTIAGILAVVYLVIGGYKLVIAQGNPDKIMDARQTIKNAIIGVVIAVVASRIVAYLAGKLAS
jgi:hypothetical protein